MSIILFLGTFIISVILKDFKNALFFPSKVRETSKEITKRGRFSMIPIHFQVRQVISDFSVIIAIFSMTILDRLVHIPTPKLEVSSEIISHNLQKVNYIFKICYWLYLLCQTLAL
jgi:solute carrier family 4 (sodium bicarbonate transporter), member 10